MKKQMTEIEKRSDIYHILNLKPKYTSLIISLFLIIACTFILSLLGEQTVALPHRTEEWLPTFKYDSVTGEYKQRLNQSVEAFNNKKKSQRQTIDIKDYCQVHVEEINHQPIKQYQLKKGKVFYNMLLKVTNQSPVMQDPREIRLEVGHQEYQATGDFMSHSFIYNSLYKGNLLYNDLSFELSPGDQVKYWVSFQIPKQMLNQEKTLNVQLFKNIQPIHMVI